MDRDAEMVVNPSDAAELSAAIPRKRLRDNEFDIGKHYSLVTVNGVKYTRTA
ncbi:hypothetical protein Atai01_24670 [Amycolatopsis taiwanensis]|uniref:Uncharacterized protein n=1 Tax=Amycolatopsis taiwanensis TaxID=342230 RepID=A0A9W6R039_9PSEU|nr:hypothetical protein Atai01_24670 [Amycolatopsis taiwanensis]